MTSPPMAIGTRLISGCEPSGMGAEPQWNEAPLNMMLASLCILALVVPSSSDRVRPALGSSCVSRNAPMRRNDVTLMTNWLKTKAMLWHGSA